MALKVGELFATLNLKDEGFNKTLNSATSSVFKGIASWKLLAAAGKAVGGAIKSAVAAGSDFSTAMSQVAATMGTTVDQIADIEAKALEMGSTTAFTATQAAEGMNVLAQAGLNARDQIATIPNVLNLAAAGAMGMDAAAGYIATTVKGFGDSMENSAYYADLMAKGATLANTSVAQLGEAFAGSAASAKSYDQTAEGTVVSLLRLAEQGVTGSEAATMLARTMQSLYAPTSTAKKALDSLGVTAYDSLGNSRQLVDVLDDMRTATAGLTDEARNNVLQTILGTRGLKAYNAMMASSSDKVKQFQKDLASSSGSAAKQAATQLDNLEGDVKLYQSAVEGMQIAVSKSMDGMFRETVQGATAIVDALHKAFDDGFSPKSLEPVLENTYNLLDSVITKVGQFSSSIASAISTKFPDLVRSMISKIPNLVSGLSDLIPSLTTSLFAGLGAAVEGTIQMLPKLVPTLVAGFGSLAVSVASGISSLFESVLRALTSGGSVIGAIEGFFDQMPQVVDEKLEVNFGVDVGNEEEVKGEITSAIEGIFSGVKDTLTNGVLGDDADAASAASEQLGQQMETLRQNVSDWQSQSIEALNGQNLSTDELAAKTEEINAQAEEMLTTLATAQTDAEAWLAANSEAATSVVQSNVDQLDGIATQVEGVETRINDLLANLNTNVETGESESIVEKILGNLDEANIDASISGIGDTIVGAIAKAIEGAGTAAGSILSAVGTKISEVLTPESIAGFVTNGVAIGTQILQAIVNGIKGVASGAVDFIGAVGENIQKAFSAIGSGDAETWVSGIGDTIITAVVDAINGIEDAGTQIMNKVSEVVSNIPWASAGFELGQFAVNLIDKIVSSIGGESFDNVMTAIGTALGKTTAGLVTAADQIVISLVKYICSSSFWTNLGSGLMDVFRTAYDTVIAFFDGLVGAQHLTEFNSSLIQFDTIEGGNVTVDYAATLKIGREKGFTDEEINAELEKLGLLTIEEDGSVKLNYECEPTYSLSGASQYAFNNGTSDRLTNAGTLKWLQDLGIITNLDEENLTYSFNVELMPEIETGLQNGENPIEYLIHNMDNGVEDLNEQYSEVEKAYSQFTETVTEPVEIPDVGTVTADTSTVQLEQPTVEVGEGAGIQESAVEAIESQLVNIPVNADVALNISVGDSNGLTIGTTIGTEISNGIAAGLNPGTVAAAANSLIVSATAAMNANQASTSSGVYFAQGFINGMSSKLEAVRDKAMELAKAAVGALKDGIAQGSPSKITMESGKFFGEGFAIGIEKSIKQSVAAATSMANLASEATVKRPSFASAAYGSASSGRATTIGIDYDQLSDAMDNRPITYEVDGVAFAKSQRNNAARQFNARQSRIEFGYGR